jgi:hypothetical protein
MRLWSLHPKYLDTKGLLAVWREGLLTQKVLSGKTKGYTKHPQLDRFRITRDMGAIGAYLLCIAKEAERRGYAFDTSKILHKTYRKKLCVTRGQLLFEYDHLKRKLQKRDKKRLSLFAHIKRPMAHPLFTVVTGTIESWEKQPSTMIKK